MRPNPQETADLVTFTKEILNGKPHFLCSVFRQFINKVKVKHRDSENLNLNMGLFSTSSPIFKMEFLEIFVFQKSSFQK